MKSCPVIAFLLLVCPFSFCLWAQEKNDDGVFLAETDNVSQSAKLQTSKPNWLSAGFSYRHKSGDSGLSHVEEWSEPALAGQWNDGNDSWTLTIRRFSLNSGTLPATALVGTYPAVPAPFPYRPQTSLTNLMEPSVQFQREHNGETFLAQLGTTPLNAPVFPLPVGRAGFKQTETDGAYWQAEIFGESKSESILSYTGMTDPYRGEKFGRVVETGFKISGYTPVGSGWGFYGELKGGWLTGEAVADNAHTAGALSMGYDTGWEWFDYFSIGPSISAEHYARNLGQFTRGHGGYFSPESLVQGGVAANFLSQKNEAFWTKGYLFAGIQTNEQAGTPFFPTEDDNRHFARDENTSFVTSVDLEAGWKFAPSSELTAHFTYGKSSDYNEMMLQTALKFFIP